MDPLSSAVIAHTLRRDPPRYDASGAPIAKVKVKVDCAVGGLVELGLLFVEGVQTIEVDVDQVSKLESLVEDVAESELVIIRRDHEAHLAKVAEAKKTGADVPDRSALPSFAYSFRRIMDRDMRPFRSVKVVKAKDETKAA